MHVQMHIITHMRNYVCTRMYIAYVNKCIYIITYIPFCTFMLLCICILIIHIANITTDNL